jgi:hypothetical protein
MDARSGSVGARRHHHQLRASLTEPVKIQTEKLEFSLPKICLRVAKRLAQNRSRKLKLKNEYPKSHIFFTRIVCAAA